MKSVSESAIYVVQVWTNADRDESREWMDVGEVTVPPRTHRKTVIEKALEDSALEVAGIQFVRVIPAGYAEPLKVEMEQPPPRLKIG
jgi:hypothetical protein